MASKNTNVLLIEDNQDIIDLLQEELAEASGNRLRLEYATRLSKGIERLKEGNIDVVLLDITLPDSRGLGSIAKVRACAPEIPVVVLTNFDDDKFAVKAVREGAQDYLVKGNVNARSLVRSIRYAVERHRALKEIKPYQSKKKPFLMKFWKERNSSNLLRRERAQGGIYSCEQFRLIIERERSRADRDGHGFSLVVFSVRDRDRDVIHSGSLAQVILSRRLRPTDEVGWFDKRNIGVLLHNTGVEGAWSFSNKIREIIAANGHPPDCSVYAYPSENLEVIAGISIKRKYERA